MARRDDREYRQYLREEQRRQPGCPARKVLPIQLIRATSHLSWIDEFGIVGRCTVGKASDDTAIQRLQGFVIGDQ
jgi:hypothetical protein